MMRRNSRALRLIPVLALVPFFLAGCHLIAGPPDGRQDWWYFCDEHACYRCTEWGCEIPDGSCLQNGACPGNMYCDPVAGICKTRTSCAVTAQCGTGLVCQNGTCVPAKTPCDSNQSCGDGAYCSNGTCKSTGRCTSNPECAKFGANFICDERGSCVPAPQPVACQTGSACPDGLCLDGSCGTCAGDCGGGITCQFNNHCGAGRVCLDGKCTSSCSGPADCGSGQTCKGSVCVPDTSNFCLKSVDCGAGKECLNNSCYPACAGTCTSAKDVCGEAIMVGSIGVRLCRPDHSARPQCTLTKDCTNGEQCVNGVCRTACTKPEDCAGCSDGPVCGKGGFCMTAIENAPQCATNAQCAGKMCLNGQCVAL